MTVLLIFVEKFVFFRRFAYFQKIAFFAGAFQMTKIIAAFTFALLCSITVTAQSGVVAPGGPTLAPPDEEFAVELPVVPSRSYLSGERDRNRRYQLKTDETYFFVFSDELAVPAQYDYALKFALAGSCAQEADSVTRRVSFGGVGAAKINFTDADGFFHRALFVKTARRAYVFQTVSTERDDPAADRFFASLKINQISGVETDASLLPVIGRAGKTVNLAETKTQATKNAAPNQMMGGNGVVTERTNSLGTPAPALPIKILSKPRAVYTDAARFYGVEGTVAVRVTFLANGQIGTIRAAQKVPFGLTGNAITAAREIRFEAPSREGVAYSVTKTVQYTFTIF
jgi:TonB family protein